MRKIIFFAAAAALPLFAAASANAASAGTFEFTVSTDMTTQEAEQKKKKPKSFIAQILKNVGWGAQSDQTYVVAAMTSQDAADAQKGCPESNENATAKPEGVEEGEEKTPVGPEPLYFAF